jgi:hypothetical protein
MLKVGDIVASSPPQDISDHYRDLYANKRFLANRRLSCFFVCEEPMFNIEYDSELIKAHVFAKRKGVVRKMSGEFFIREAVPYLEGVLDGLEVLLLRSGTNKDALVDQVERDISSGVYDAYLRTP